MNRTQMKHVVAACNKLRAMGTTFEAVGLHQFGEFGAAHPSGSFSTLVWLQGQRAPKTPCREMQMSLAAQKRCLLDEMMWKIDVDNVDMERLALRLLWRSFTSSRGATKHLAALAWQSALQLVEVMAKQGQGVPVANVWEGLQEDIGSVFCHTDHPECSTHQVTPYMIDDWHFWKLWVLEDFSWISSSSASSQQPASKETLGL